MAQPTKTLNPLPFQDLDPHRFEDLVRELIYDFKDWYKIEATGKAGSDDGFDVRAWEKNTELLDNEDSEDEDTIESKPNIEGNLWMIQCKREKQLGPKRIAQIIEETVKTENPPYGYLLVAPANFSKQAYDTFAEELRKRGVMEFYLWGRSELEHFMLLPKNDHILFAFFGISLITKRRSRVTEIKGALNNKNKITKALGGTEHYQLHSSILLRDINDKNYPYKHLYKDFSKNPRWKEYIAVQLHPLGLIFHVGKFYAYIDRDKKEIDIIEPVNLVVLPNETEIEETQDYESRKKAEYLWDNLPKKNRAKFNVFRFLRFSDMLLIDDKGDVLYKIPHIFANYNHKGKGGFFSRGWEEIIYKQESFEPSKEGYKLVKIFPKELPEIKRGNIYKDRYVEWDSQTKRQFFASDNIEVFYDFDNKYSDLNPKDVIAVKSDVEGREDEYIQITHKYETTVGEYLKENPFYKQDIERQSGKTINDTDRLTVFEIKKVYSFELRDDS